MRLTLLGSAAAEAWPGLFCECEWCREARRRGGRNLRRRTAYRINSDTLVDFGPDIHWQVTAFGIDLAEIRHILFTHSHSDHLDPVELFWRHPGFCRVSNLLEIYGNQQVMERIGGDLSATMAGPAVFDTLRLAPTILEPGQTVTAGELRVTALEANHAGPAETALNYVVEQDGKALLIGNDTGWWADPTWELVRRFKLDVAVLECTYCLGKPDARDGHLGADAMLAMRDRLAELGVLKPDARVVANHFAHNGFTLYEELCEYLEPRGVTVGYDGLVVEA